MRRTKGTLHQYFNNSTNPKADKPMKDDMVDEYGDENDENDVMETEVQKASLKKKSKRFRHGTTGRGRAKSCSGKKMVEDKNQKKLTNYFIFWDKISQGSSLKD